MREIRYTSRFKKDYKREKSGKHSKFIDEIIAEVLSLLVEDAALPKTYCDHSLTGNWKDCRECHLRPDLLMIYRKTQDNCLELVRMGSHSELF